MCIMLLRSRGLSIANSYQGDLRAALAAEDQLMEHTLTLQDLNDFLTWRVLEGGLTVVVWLTLAYIDLASDNLNI